MNRVRELRLKTEMKSYELAYHAHVAPGTLSNIEQGWGGATPKAKKRIADALGVTVEEAFPPDEAIQSSAATALLLEVVESVRAMRAILEGGQKSTAAAQEQTGVSGQ